MSAPSLVTPEPAPCWCCGHAPSISQSPFGLIVACESGTCSNGIAGAGSSYNDAVADWNTKARVATR